MKKLFLFSVMCVFCFFASAQKLTGNLVPLKDQPVMKVEFDYSKVTYDGDSEATFFKDKAKGKDNPEQWKKDWTSTFRENWQASFVEEFNEETKDISMKLSQDEAADFVMTVQVADIDPGSFAGPFSQPTAIESMIIIKKGGTQVATIVMKEVSGNPYFMTPIDEDRVNAAFKSLGEKAGETMVKLLKKAK